MGGGKLIEVMKTPETPTVLAITTTIAVFIILVLIWVHPVPLESKDLFSGTATEIVTAWVGVVGYYFGSNQSAKHKDELLANSIPIEKKEVIK